MAASSYGTSLLVVNSIPRDYNSLYYLARHLTRSLLSLIRWRVEHSKRNSIWTRTHILFSIYWMRANSRVCHTASMQNPWIVATYNEFSYVSEARSLREWVFIQPYSNRLLTVEKVADECKASKLVNKCSHKNCLRLELFDCEKVFCVAMEL